MIWTVLLWNIVVVLPHFLQLPKELRAKTPQSLRFVLHCFLESSFEIVELRFLCLDQIDRGFEREVDFGQYSFERSYPIFQTLTPLNQDACAVVRARLGLSATASGRRDAFKDARHIRRRLA